MSTKTLINCIFLNSDFVAHCSNLNFYTVSVCFHQNYFFITDDMNVSVLNQIGNTLLCDLFKLQEGSFRCISV